MRPRAWRYYPRGQNRRCQPWRKKYPHVVEECFVVNVYDAADPAALRLVVERTGVPLPPLTLTRRRCGAVMRTFVVCPVCARECEYVVLPPCRGCYHCRAAQRWACRVCNNATWASQRYENPRDPLRQARPPRFRKGRIPGALTLPTRTVRIGSKRILLPAPLPVFARNEFGIAYKRIA